jgi:hypothetical protein
MIDLGFGQFLIVLKEAHHDDVFSPGGGYQPKGDD